ncbi:MAG TPA: DUF86 domain-containing protein, partial [Pseudorhizobium sp.]|nr:DUF86 domain-containing protein [Pseudorhizobium sp.]
RLRTYLDEMELAAKELENFLAGVSRDEFGRSVLIQRAVGMNLLILGEASARLAEEFPLFVEEHPDIPWVKIRGMRNRIAHGYLSINLDTVWQTSKTAIPDLLNRLHALRHWRPQGE